MTTRLRVGDDAHPCSGTPTLFFDAYVLRFLLTGVSGMAVLYMAPYQRTNRAFWAAKLERNVNRDRAVAERLQSRGWGVLRVWQHDLGDAAAVAHRVTTAIADSSIMPYRPASEAVAAASSPYARLIFPDSNIAVLSELRV